MSADLKTGQLRNYREQMAAYALGFMDATFRTEWTAHLLFCDQRQLVTHRFTYEEAKAHYRPFNRLVDEDPQSREGLADACASALIAGQAAFVTANNKAEGSSPLSMAKLAKRILEKLGRT